MNRPLLITLVLAAVLVAVPATAGDQSPLSLADSVMAAKEANRAVELGRVQADIARAAFQMAGDAVPSGPNTPQQVQAQVLERQAQASWRIAEHAYRHLIESIAYQVETSYFAVLQSRRMKLVAADALAAARRQSELAEAMREAGSASDFDLLEGRSAVSNAEAALVSAGAAVRMAEVGYNAVLGRDLEQEVLIIDVLNELEPLGELPDIERLEQQALVRRFEVKAAEEMVALRRFEYEAAGKFGLDGTPGHDLARLKLRQAELELEIERDRVRVELRQHLTALRDAEARVLARRTTAAAGAGYLRLAELRYEHGAGTSMELSMARLGREQAALQLTAAYHDYQTARARLRLAVGQ